MAQEMDAEVSAIQALLSALEPLDDESRIRVIKYVSGRFSISGSTLPSVNPTATGSVVPPEDPTASTITSGVVMDIRTLKEAKSPRSAVEMVVLVAYYLSELAPPDERRDTIGTAELTKYFKQADYRLPSTPRVTLHNAKSGGYLDSSSHGQYKLNPVGYNLVAHGLPSATPRKRTAKSTARKSTKKTTRRTGARKKTTRARRPSSNS